jgi:hypothetical protein
MSSFTKRGCLAALAGTAWLAISAATAHAQPGQMMVGQAAATGGAGRIMSLPATAGMGMGAMGGGFNPYYPGDYNAWAGGTLTGAANLVGAQGQLMVSQQQAFLQREQVRAAKTDNRRRTFDEYMYEKEHTPSAEEERQRAQREYLARARNNPPPVEIWSGSALNTILQDLQKRSGPNNANLGGFSLPLDEETLSHINVTSGRGDGNAGLLKNGGKLSWPDALSDPVYKNDRDDIANGIADAMKQAQFNGKVDPGTVRQLQKSVDGMGRLLRKNVDNVGVNDYIEAKTFLNNLDSSVAILKQPDVGSYLNGKYALKARNVGDLVSEMTNKGLTFTNAVPGDESAYNALYQAMANCDNALVARQQ